MGTARPERAARPASTASPATSCYNASVGIVNRRNAVLGWGVWQIGKRVAKRKAKSAVPAVEDGRPNKSLWAVAIAGVVGALTFWRSHRESDS